MKSPYKRLLPFAAIACIGLAGSSVDAFAQAQAPAGPGGPGAINGRVGPEPFHCAQGEWQGKVTGGKDDNFAGGAQVPEKPSPSSFFQTSLPNLNLNLPANVYDQTASNYHFGDTLGFTPPPGHTVTKARLTTRLKPNSGDATNDGISFSSNPWSVPIPGARVGFAINSLPGAATWAPPHPPELFVFDFDPANVKVYGNGVPGTPAAGPPYNGLEFFKALNANKRFDTYVEDDTGVDFVQLELCAVRKYDLVASKKHDGNVYILDVTNAGQQINPTGKIDVVELVPAGLTILPFTPPPGWVCPGITFPVIGPDAFTCTFAIPAGGIATGAHLPPIVLKTDGTAECPNCMRARLFLKEVSDGVKPVDEGDMMKNNASCTR